MNLDAPRGELRAEVLDEQGLPIAGYTAADCVPVSADSTRQAVTWKSGADLASLAGKPARFRFSLKRGSLYAFWVSPDDQGHSRGFVAAGGPGYVNHRDG